MVKSQLSHKALLISDYHDGQLLAVYGSSGKRSENAGSSDRKVQRLFAQGLRSMFLPEGYPRSVSSDYLSFQLWDTVQALSSYIRGLLTSQAILKGVGVGQQAATPLAAVFLFFVRDLAGMLGGILFAFSQGSSFDTCAKQWRLFADVTNDVGMAVELASPFSPAAFLPMACFGSIARSVTGVAGGATRAALTQHFALRGNAADVSAKESSQETATTLIGMVLGMAFTHLTSGNVLSGWALFILLTAIHVWANIRALRCLVLDTMNTPRLQILVQHYMNKGTVPSPVEVAALEDLVAPPVSLLADTARTAAGLHKLHLNNSISFGCNVSDLVTYGRLSNEELVDLVQAAVKDGQPYLVHVTGRQVFVAVHSDCSKDRTTLLKAYVHALAAAHVAALGHDSRQRFMATLADQHLQDPDKNKTSSGIGVASGSTLRRRITEQDRDNVVRGEKGAKLSGSNVRQDDTEREENMKACRMWMRCHYDTFLTKCKHQGWKCELLLRDPKSTVQYAMTGGNQDDVKATMCDK